MRYKKWISSKHKKSIRKNHQKDFHFTDTEKSELRAEEGRKLEERLCCILKKMKESGEIREYIRHLPHSPEDLQGKDFTVIFDDPSPISFGITCSFACYKRYFQNHPRQECLWITNQSDEEIQQMLKNFIDRR